MSAHGNRHFRDPRVHFNSITDFNHSVDVKRFSKDKHIPTPTYARTPSIHKKINLRSNEKAKPTQTNSLVSSLSKHISQKNMKTKRKLSSGCTQLATQFKQQRPIITLQEKYQIIKENFFQGNYKAATSLIRHSILHFQYSQEQKNLYYWLTLSLGHLRKFDQALEEISQCLQLYPSFYQGFLLSAELNIKKRQFKKAIQQIQLAMRISPESSQSYLQLTLCYQKMGEKRKQKQLLDSIITKFPKQLVFVMLLVECSISLGEIKRCQQYVNHLKPQMNTKDSLALYILGLLEKVKGQNQEAYILFEQALKYNNHKVAVDRSLLEVIKIDIEGRDFYKAYHSVGRAKHLKLQQNQSIKIYGTFIEGVMAMMKKKSQEAITILSQISMCKKCHQMGIQSLIYKYLAYGYFKIDEYAKSIKYYSKIPKEQMDQSSKYNMLLAQGIYFSDTQHLFPQAISKFLQASKSFSQKVEPYLYISMTHIFKFNLSKCKEQIKRAQVLIEALKEMQVACKLNPNSSNLLYHRTIIHLYFQDWQLAHEDINKCIEKAEQNLPKYFYLRGVCHSCVRDFKKAINQFSICLSLDSNYQEAYLQKAKCYFLLGNTEKGFSSLKSFIELNPDDLSIYKWIGDLLYQGRSYRDALKSYSQFKSDDLQALVMRAKCYFRVGNVNDVVSHIRLFQKSNTAEKGKVQLDLTAFSLINSLLKHQSSKVIISGVHKLNKLLQENIVGYVFQLIDSMNLLGVASFYLQKYSDAYQSFLLVLQLYQSLCDKEISMIKTDESQQELDLRCQDIYFNIILCELARGNIKEALSMVENQYLSILSENKQKRKIQKLVSLLKQPICQTFEWQFRSDKPINFKMKKMEFDCGCIKIKSKPVFNLYHQTADHLYASQVAEKIISQFHAGYIDTMPQGPWIKRNPFGVVFTEEIMPSQNSISLENTFRQKDSQPSQSFGSRILQEEEEQEEKKTISKKQDFLRKLQFEEGVEERLNKLIKNRKDI